jgi:hypothetical protein
MHASYDDIISRIGMPPIWFDERAVPRYCEFAPHKSASIHIGEIALLEIKCQGCGHLFQVACSSVNVPSGIIAEAIKEKALRYGDPPNVQCCRAGPTMSSTPIRVVQYWRRHDQQYVEKTRIMNLAYFEWVRDPSLDVDIQPKS